MCNQVPFCGLRATLKDGCIVRVDGNPDHPKNKPCVKGLTSVQALYDPNRLLYPVKRTNPEKGVGIDPGWERISWDEALDTIAAKLNEAKETYGADSVIFSAGDRRRTSRPSTAWARCSALPTSATAAPVLVCPLHGQRPHLRRRSGDPA